MTESKATDNQVGGDHYKKLAMQPVEIAYLIGATPMWMNICKYITRDKYDMREDYAKAIHCVELEFELMEPRCKKYIAELVPFDHTDIKQFAAQFDNNEFVDKVLQDVFFGRYKSAAEAIAVNMAATVEFNTQHEG